MIIVLESVKKNIVGKGENAGYYHVQYYFLLSVVKNFFSLELGVVC